MASSDSRQLTNIEVETELKHYYDGSTSDAIDAGFMSVQDATRPARGCRNAISITRFGMVTAIPTADFRFFYLDGTVDGEETLICFLVDCVMLVKHGKNWTITTA